MRTFAKPSRTWRRRPYRSNEISPSHTRRVDDNAPRPRHRASDSVTFRTAAQLQRRRPRTQKSTATAQSLGPSPVAVSTGFDSPLVRRVRTDVGHGAQPGAERQLFAGRHRSERFKGGCSDTWPSSSRDTLTAPRDDYCSDYSCFWSFVFFFFILFQDPAGIFELIEVVGNGTYGQVYKVSDPCKNLNNFRQIAIDCVRI